MGGSIANVVKNPQIAKQHGEKSKGWLNETAFDVVNSKEVVALSVSSPGG